MNSRLKPFVSAGVILLVAIVSWWIGASSAENTTEATDTTGAPTISAGAADDNAADDTSPPTTTATEAPAGTIAAFSDLPPIVRSELPPEAINTLDDIANGGPFDFSKDDSVFQNREGFLPDQERGHYREYTVITPGSDDRGARRIVAGADGELYYTDDHYASFREIIG